MKKILSLLLAVAMVASIFAMLPIFTVSAADPEHIGNTDMADILIFKEKIAVKKDSWSSSAMDSSKLFDGKAEGSGGTKMEGQLDGTVTVTWQTESADTAYHYAIYTGNDTGYWQGRNPDSWVLYGSTDGIDYVVIDAVTTPGMANADGKAFVYAIDTPAAYSYYKIELTKSNHYFQINEIELFNNNAAENLPKDTAEGSISYGRYLVPSSFSTGVGCGFLDGNMNFSSYGISRLLGLNNTNDVMAVSKVYLNGVEAKFNKTYLGYTHCGLNGGDGYFFGIVSAGYDAGTENTVTILIGDDYYATGTFTPDSSALAVTESITTYYTGLNRLVSTVTFDKEHSLTEGATISMRLHDDHTDRTATVTKVDGKTVTLEVTNFSTSKSLCEFTISEGLKFTVPVDQVINTKTETAVGYIQTRENATDPENTFDARVIIEAHKDYVTSFQSATLEVVFNVEGGGTKTAVGVIDTAYASIVAGNDTYTATDDCALFGLAVIGVPFGTSKISAKVIFDKGLETEEELVLGSSSLALTSKSDLATIKALNKYDPANITVTAASDSNNNINAGEGAVKLFDGTTGKYGSHTVDISVSFTTKEAITISGIIFTVANDTFTSGASRTYKSWTLYGITEGGEKEIVAISNTAITTGVASYNSGSVPAPDDVVDGNREAYLVQNAGTYSSFVIEIVGGGGYTQMAEITLYTK